jgi:hypothetical protein
MLVPSLAGPPRQAHYERVVVIAFDLNQFCAAALFHAVANRF